MLERVSKFTRAALRCSSQILKEAEMWKRLPGLYAMQGWVLTLVFLSVCGISRTAYGSTYQSDVNALLALRNEWTGSSALQWTGADPCGDKWVGVTCNGSTGAQRVTSLVLTGLGLAGILPVDVGLLTELQTLDLSYNNLTGEIPSQLGSLINLEYLILQSNYFSGPIPKELGQLGNLQYLYLTNNSLGNRIPNELGSLKSLFWLDLAYNGLQGPLPFSSDGNDQSVGLDNLTNAQHFHLNNNKFSGSIPTSLCHSGMKLIHMLLDSNLLSGSIPSEVGQCSALIILKLDNNNLRGEIPSQIGQLSHLNELQLGSNSLSGAVPNLSNLSNLQLLSLSNNTFDGDLPTWLLLLTSLTDLDMQYTGLSGTIPSTLFALPELISVTLDHNELNGTLDLSKAGEQLKLVSLEDNSIHTIDQGQYSGALQLQGNPICEGSSSANLNSKVCTTLAPPSVGSNTSCSTSCPSGFTVNPAVCSCGIPYKGVFTYRAPTFTIMNASRIELFKSALAKLLQLSESQIQVSNENFNDQNQLSITVLIFPVGSSRWTRDNILTMSTLMGTTGVSPTGFGPPLFDPVYYSFEDVGGNSGSSLSTTAIIGIAVGASVLVLVVCGLCCFAVLQKRRADKAVELSKPYASWGASGGESGGAPKLKGARWFSYSELKKATNNFIESNEIGSGGYGKVYRGILLSGEQVAIKRAQENSMQGATEFKNEIELLSRVHHKNVVGLVGFCFEQGEQMLVYEYMANGTLRDSLLGRTGVKMDWHRRLMIALGSARGIAYLHELANPPIIHRDIKSSNILLDEKRVAKVADFGLSKIGPGEGSGKGHVSTQVKGTLGYLDPEYYLSQQLTEKSDVYSYGVVLLELITARKPIERGKYIVREVKGVMDKGGIAGLRPMVDPRIRDESPELEQLLRIALACVEETAANRPSMGEVVKELEDLIGHDYPESGSSNIEVDKGQPLRHPYGSDSEFMHTSKDSSDPSFL